MLLSDLVRKRFFMTNITPPKILYKYKKIDDFTKRLFKNDELFFTPFSELNDPNEMFFNYAQDEIPIREIDDIRVVDGGAAARHVLKTLKERYGVFCLTEKNDDLLMYDYYADGHKGICIEFSWEKIGIEYKTNQCLQLPQKVIYSTKPLSVSVINTDLKDFYKIYSTKWSGYAHEKEWRLFYQPGIFQHINVRNSITGIIFGCAMSENDKKYIKDLLKNRDDISYYQANAENKKYALKITPA